MASSKKYEAETTTIRFDRELLKLVRIEAIKQDKSLKEMFQDMWDVYEK